MASLSKENEAIALTILHFQKDLDGAYGKSDAVSNNDRFCFKAQSVDEPEQAIHEIKDDHCKRYIYHPPCYQCLVHLWEHEACADYDRNVADVIGCAIFHNASHTVAR